MFFIAFSLSIVVQIPWPDGRAVAGAVHWSSVLPWSADGVPQPSDCSMSSSCLSRSVNSIARRRNWRATAARRCASSARRSSRPMLCASVCVMVAPVDHGWCRVPVSCAVGGSVGPALRARRTLPDVLPSHRPRRLPFAATVVTVQVG